GTIAEVQPVSDKEVLLLGKGPGSTTLRIWDARGRTEYAITILPGPAHLQQTIQEAIGLPGVKVRMIENAALLDGEVANTEQRDRAQQIASAFAEKVVNLLRLSVQPTPPSGPSLAEQVQAVLPAGEVTAEALPGQPNVILLRGNTPSVEDLQAIEKLAQKVVQTINANGAVINLIQLAQPRQVRVQARMLNVDENYLRDLGLRWNESTTYGQAVPGGSFKLRTAISTDLSTIENGSHAEVLAAPSIVVNSNALGHIMIGGEVPIPTVVTGVTGPTGTVSNGSTGVGTVGQSVMFRPYGVLLNIEPVVEPNEEVTLRLLTEVSSIDKESSVKINGSDIPGFLTRRTITDLRLKAGETLIISGLISREEANAVTKFPFLADIPILGNFFRAVRKDKKERELVLFLTPEVLPGPEPPAGLRQSPLLKPVTDISSHGVYGATTDSLSDFSSLLGSSQQTPANGGTSAR
ncbi:MAG TPA: pilus assembly protein N-terminal domain-containing protein, partial [Armatimonadota bacterium]|nr:pilus assembly protein N-terminal domain-containing protein [Armatimonadota bacterium]